LPDPTLKTVSASQAPAVCRVSPYITEWQLYQHFIGAAPLDESSSELMEWGKRMQPIILQWASDELGLEVIENRENIYTSHGVIGATPDGLCIDPERGPGRIEAKNVSGWAFRDDWTDTMAPQHVEIQHQTQLMVPARDGKGGLALPAWGAIVALVDGREPHLYMREPMPEVQAVILENAERFMRQVAEHDEPPIDGKAIEIPTLLALYPEANPEIVKAVDAEAEQIMRDYVQAKAQASFYEKAKKESQAKLLRIAEDAGVLMAPTAALTIKKAEIKGGAYERKTYIRTSLTFKEIAEADDIDDVPDLTPLDA